jgi:hypothetical protein
LSISSGVASPQKDCNSVCAEAAMVEEAMTTLAATCLGDDLNAL